MKLVFVGQLNWVIQVFSPSALESSGLLPPLSPSPKLQRLLRVGFSGVKLLSLCSYLMKQSFKLLKILK